MKKYDLLIDKYQVSQSGYFRIGTTIVLGYGYNRFKFPIQSWYFRGKQRE